MAYRESYTESREQYVAAYDEEEAARYDSWITALTPEDHDACLPDINRHFAFKRGMSVLDAGAGTGALSLALTKVPGLRITALEPCPAMLRRLKSQSQLREIAAVQGFCDHLSDRSHFANDQFDVVASRQLVNSLFDPLAAFRNWYCWLRDSGVAIVMDGLFDRADWSGPWEKFVDALPLSACRTIATVPYLLEQTGFQIAFAGFMEFTNMRPSTRTRRYMVVATKGKYISPEGEDH